MLKKTKLQAVAEAYRKVVKEVGLDDPRFQELLNQEIDEVTQRERISEQADLSVYVPGASTKKLVETNNEEEDSDDIEAPVDL